MLTVMYSYEYCLYEYSFLTVNSNVKHKLSKSGVKNLPRLSTSPQQVIADDSKVHVMQNLWLNAHCGKID